MTEKKSNSSRRKLLKSIAVGSGTVMAGKSLPESWSKPVVDSVMLPVHAATTVACDSLTIAGNSGSCGDGPGYQQTLYYIDDTGECPVLMLPDENTSPIPSYNLVGPGILISTTTIQAFFIISGTQQPLEIIQDCASPIEGPDQIAFNEVILAYSGAQWRATGTLSRTVTSITVSDITLVPI